MTKTELGLPLEYQKMPEYFDAHNGYSTSKRVKLGLSESNIANNRYLSAGYIKFLLFGKLLVSS